MTIFQISVHERNYEEQINKDKLISDYMYLRDSWLILQLWKFRLVSKKN